jgi:rubrerythrin
VIDPLALSALILAGVSACAAGAALWVSSRGSNAHTQREVGEVANGFEGLRRLVNSALADNQGLREEFAKQRVFIAETLEDAVDAMQQSERKRKAARTAQRHADEARELEQYSPQQQQSVCPLCQYPHPGIGDVQNCTRAATVRFRAEGHAV